MGHPLDADEFSVPIRLPEVTMFWSLDQVCQMLGVTTHWIKGNITGTRAETGKPDKRKLRVVDITPGSGKPTYRVKHSELQRFLSFRNIPYA